MYARLTQARESTFAAPPPTLQDPPDTFPSTATSFLLAIERAMVSAARQEVVLQQELLKCAQRDMTWLGMHRMAEFSYLREDE